MNFSIWNLPFNIVIETEESETADGGGAAIIKKRFLM
jgi:hypothetical protein